MDNLTTSACGFSEYIDKHVDKEQLLDIKNLDFLRVFDELPHQKLLKSLATRLEQT